MAGVGTILVRRAIVLAAALVIIMFLTGIIMEATGYSEKVWRAIIDARVRAYSTRLRQRATGGEYCIILGDDAKETINGTMLQKKVTGNLLLYTVRQGLDVSDEPPLKYTNPYKPPQLPEIAFVGPKVVVENGEFVAPLVTITVERPDGIIVPIYNATLKVSGLNITNETNIYIVNRTVILKTNTKILMESLLTAISEKYLGGKEINTTAGLLDTYLYSTVSERNGKIILQPLYGKYRFYINITYPSQYTIDKPVDEIVIRIGAPRECYPISILLKWKRENLTILYGLNKPWYERVIPLVIRTLTGQLGTTDKTDVVNVAGVQPPAPVWDVILMVLPRTIVVLTVAEIICMLIALPLAPRIAYHYGTKIDRIVVSYAALFNAIPVWWLAMIFIFLFAYELHIFPPTGLPVVKYINSFWDNPLTNLVNIMYYAALPIIVIVITFLGSWLYSVRAVVLRIVREDFVVVAKAKGLPESMIVRKYIVRVAAPPIVTYVILGLASSIGGMIITESVFYWPGMGTLYYAAISNGDVATILGLTYVTTLVYIVARWILEALYIWLDPRVRYR